MPDDLPDALRRLGDRLDRSAAPVTAEEVMERGTAQAPHRSSRWLVAAACVVAVVILAAIAVVRRPHDQPVVSGSTTTATTSTVAPAPSTSTTFPEVPVPIRTELADLPTWGFAVVDADHTSILGPDGKLIERADLHFDPFSRPGRAEISPGGTDGGVALRLVPAGAGQSVPGCAQDPGYGQTGLVASGDVRALACGPGYPRRIDTVDVFGRLTTLVGLPAPGQAGYWLTVQPSPDGRWVGAQWSGECEAPVTYAVPVTGVPDGSTIAPLLGTVREDSVFMGWTPESEALVEVPNGGCGDRPAPPGVYRVDPATRHRTLLIASSTEPTHQPPTIWVWHRTGGDASNARERAVDQAVASIHATAAGEPSEGQGDVHTVVTWAGHQVALVADDPDGSAFGAQPTRRAADGLGGRLAVSGPVSAPEHAFWFTCGGTLYRLGGPQPGVDPAPDDSVRDLAAAMVPYLGCVLGPPPLP